MNACRIFVVSLLFSTLCGCASSKHPAYCTAEPFDVKVSLRHPDSPALHLIRIEKSRRVVIRDDLGDILSARPGEQFVRRDGTEANLKLKSVDLSSGSVTIQAYEYVMHAAQ